MYRRFKALVSPAVRAVLLNVHAILTIWLVEIAVINYTPHIVNLHRASAGPVESNMVNAHRMRATANDNRSLVKVIYVLRLTVNRKASHPKITRNAVAKQHDRLVAPRKLWYIIINDRHALTGSR